MANIVILTQMQFPATIDGAGVMHFVSGLLMGLSAGEMLSGMIVIRKKLMKKDLIRTCIKSTKRLRHLLSQIPEPYLCGLFNRNFAGRSKFLLIHLRQDNRQNAGFVFCLDILGLYIADIEAT